MSTHKGLKNFHASYIAIIHVLVATLSCLPDKDQSMKYFERRSICLSGYSISPVLRIIGLSYSLGEKMKYQKHLDLNPYIKTKALHSEHLGHSSVVFAIVSAPTGELCLGNTSE